jgi:hypothetical protein
MAITLQVKGLKCALQLLGGLEILGLKICFRFKTVSERLFGPSHPIVRFWLCCFVQILLFAVNREERRHYVVASPSSTDKGT